MHVPVLLRTRFSRTRREPDSPAHPGDSFVPAQPTDCFAIVFPGRAVNFVSPAHPGDQRERGATFSEVLVAAALTSIGVVGAMGAFDAADKIVARDVLAARALALAESRLEAKRAVPWAQLLFDDLNHDGVPETSMHDDGSGGDRIAGDGIYSAMSEQEGVKLFWTVAAHPSGPLDRATGVVIEARGVYSAAGSLREVRLATLRANSSFTGPQ